MRVLIADDEAPARDKLRRWFSEHADIELLADAADGLQAAELIEAARPTWPIWIFRCRDSAGWKWRRSSNQRMHR